MSIALSVVLSVVVVLLVALICRMYVLNSGISVSLFGQCRKVRRHNFDNVYVLHCVCQFTHFIMIIRILYGITIGHCTYICVHIHYTSQLLHMYHCSVS